MSTTQIITQSDSNITNLKNAINSDLGNIDLNSIQRVDIQYASDRNRISVVYNPSSEGSNNFEIIALTDSNMDDLTAALNDAIAKELATSAQLIPVNLDVAYGNSRHRAVAGCQPAEIGGDPKLTYTVISFKNNNIGDLQDEVNKWLSDNAATFQMIDVSYYYGNSSNRAFVLYSTRP